MTYDAFAARLVAEHGLRLGFEADPTMLTGASRYRLAARVVKAAAGPFEFISRLRPATVTERVLRLDADLQQHLVDPAELDKHTRDLLVGPGIRAAEQPGPDVRRRGPGHGRRPGTAGAGQPGAGVPGAQAAARAGGVRRPDGHRRPARRRRPRRSPQRSGRASRWCCWTSTRTPRPPRRRCCAGCSPGATPSEGLGHPVTAVGRPAAGDLRLAGGGGEQHPDLRRELPPAGRPARDRLRPHRQPAQRALHPGPGQRAQRAAAGRGLQPRGVGGSPGISTVRAWAGWRRPPRRRPARSAPRPSTPGARRSAGSPTRWSPSARPDRRRGGPTSPC